ncbi:MAG: calcium-binding protein [Nostoc sp. ChiSLP02]|nr:calcium-binding protein [Nostoc sp. DedSLP05]MDZ8103210.1 calcium-binding protein [Nostoc sp. DedSLP01]MDZ8188039.1 calcium-binding protein [Nostoc sp. ChiSLP02]
MANITGTNGNDTLVGTSEADKINGKAGNDTIAPYNYTESYQAQDTLTGGGGKDKFVYNSSFFNFSQTNIITDFRGVGKALNPLAAVIAEVDTLIFQGSNLTAQNLLLAQNGKNLEISFEGVDSGKIILQNFTLENLDNLSTVGNILFNGQTSITDRFDVLDAKSTQQKPSRKNTVTFFNDLNNNIIGFDNSNDVINAQGGNDKIDGLSGNDLLRGGAGNDTLIGGAGNDTLVAGDGSDSLVGGDGNDTLSAFAAKGNNTLNSGAGDDYLNIDYSSSDNLLLGGDGNDTLSASGATGNSTLNGGAGNDIFYSESDNFFWSDKNKILTGGGGKDKFVLGFGFTSTVTTITDFGGIGKGSNPSAATLGSLDTLQFRGSEQTARNLQLTQNGNNLEITFGAFQKDKVILQNFALENLDNSPQVGNILFYGQSSITDSFDVFDANSTQSTLSNKNTVTFLNALNNNVNGFDASDDVINGQGGNDKIDGLSGDDLLRGGAGSDTLIGGVGDDQLTDVTGNNSLVGGIGSDELFVIFSDGDNTLNGGAGNDTLDANSSTGDNLLNGGDGDDSVFAFTAFTYDYPASVSTYTTSGNNTLNGGTGNDHLSVIFSTGDNLLSGGDGNDYLSASVEEYVYEMSGSTTSGNNTLDGGNGNDYINADFASGKNVLIGGNGDDTLYGGTGIDTFVFNSFNEGSDRIYNFNPTNEKIQVSAAGFGGGLSIGSLAANQFTLGTSATTSAQRFIYNASTGALYFDRDGSAGGFTQVQLAQFFGEVTLNKDNFVVV